MSAALCGLKTADCNEWLPAACCLWLLSHTAAAHTCQPLTPAQPDSVHVQMAAAGRWPTFKQLVASMGWSIPRSVIPFSKFNFGLHNCRQPDDVYEARYRAVEGYAVAAAPNRERLVEVWQAACV